MRTVAILNRCAKVDAGTPTAFLKLVVSVFFVYSTKGGKFVQSILAPVGELLEMHLRVICKGNVGFAVFIQGADFTAFDVIHPTVQTKRIIAQPNRDTRVRF